MKITEKDWKNYIKLLSTVDNRAGDFMRQYIKKHGFESLSGMEDYAYAIVQKYGEASGALSAEMYDAIAEVQQANVPAAEIADLPTKDEVSKVIRGVTKKSKSPNMVANSVSRLVKRTGADTMLKNAKRDGAQFAWVPMGDTCSFCITLASRGWQYMSENAMKNGHAEHIHANCDCTYAVRFDKKSGVAGYDPAVYKAMYDSAEGKSSKDKINSMRRAAYAQNKDQINAQKRAAYGERKDGFSNNKNSGKIDTEGKREPLRIPQIPASTITQKIREGEYSLKLSQQNYDKHIPGTFDYERYRKSRENKGLSPQSVLTISKKEAQSIILNQSGTGIIKPRRDGTATDIERITCSEEIGYYFNRGKKFYTNKAAIHHGRRGSHIVPIKGNDYD